MSHISPFSFKQIYLIRILSLQILGVSLYVKEVQKGAYEETSRIEMDHLLGLKQRGRLKELLEGLKKLDKVSKLC
jgi:hypothetical protein